jgi:predicted transcriptional regulator
MSTPKLEACVTILQVLNNKGQLGAGGIASATRINPSFLGDCLSILAEQGMVERKEVGAAVYAITENGRRVLNFFKMESALETKQM